MRHYKKLLSISKFTKMLVTITLAFSLIISIVNTTFAYDNLEIRDKISFNEAKSSNSSYEENEVLEKENKRIKKSDSAALPKTGETADQRYVLVGLLCIIGFILLMIFKILKVKKQS